jgi:hypothetical protein
MSYLDIKLPESRSPFIVLIVVRERERVYLTYLIGYETGFRRQCEAGTIKMLMKYQKPL